MGPAPVDPASMPWYARAGATALRVLPPIAAAASEVGLPLVGAAGGLGEAGAELLERQYPGAPGGRQTLNPKQIAVQTALGLIPGVDLVGPEAGALARTGVRAGEGALIGGAGTAATELAEGRKPTIRELLLGGGVGAGLGGGAGALEARAGRQAAREAVSSRLDEVVQQARPAATPATPANDRGAYLRVEGLGRPMVPVDPGNPDSELMRQPAPPQQPRPDDRLANQVGPQVDRLYGSLPPEKRDFLRQVITEDADELANWTRGKQSVARSTALANELVIDPERLGKFGRGEVPPDEEIAALGNHVAFYTSKAYDNARLAAEHPDQPQYRIAAQEAAEKLQIFDRVHTARAAELGRGLNMLRYQRSVYGGYNDKAVRAALKSGIDSDQLVSMLGKFAPDDVVGQYQFIRSLREPNLRDYARWSWYSALLSRPRTAVKILIGTSFNLAKTIAATATEGAYQAARGVPEAERTVFAGEVPWQLHAIRTALPDSFRKALFMLKNGFSERAAREFELRPPEVFGGAMLPNLPGRVIGAAHEFLRNVGVEVERHAYAYTAARKAGGSSDEIATAMTNMLAAPDRAMLKHMRDFGARVSFQEEMPPWMTSFMRFRAELPPSFGVVADIVMPFIKTPFNVFRQGVQLTPIGFTTSALKQGGRAGAQAHGEALLGTLALAPIAWMASQGYLTGAGPHDRAQADAMYRQGWRPHSIRIPQAGGRDIYIPYSQLHPMAMPLAAVANAVDLYRETGKIEPLAIGARTAGSVLQESFLGGTASLLEMLTDPDRNLNKWVDSMAENAIPMAGALRSIREAEDVARGQDYVREPKTIPEAIGTTLPTELQHALGLPDAQPRIRATGEPATRGWNVPGVLTGVNVTQAPPTSPFEQELARLHQTGAFKGLPLPSTKTLTVGRKKEQLSSRDATILAQAQGMLTRRYVENEMATEGYHQATDEKRAYFINRLIATAHRAVRERAISQHIRKGYLDLEELAK